MSTNFPYQQKEDLTWMEISFDDNSGKEKKKPGQQNVFNLRVFHVMSENEEVFCSAPTLFQQTKEILCSNRKLVKSKNFTEYMLSCWMELNSLLKQYAWRRRNGGEEKENLTSNKAIIIIIFEKENFQIIIWFLFTII